MSDNSEIAINLIPLRPGVEVDEFAKFSAEVDQPVCLAQDVVLGFDAYAIRRRAPGAPAFDIVEMMEVRSWDEWVGVRDGLDELGPVTEGFDRMVDSSQVHTLFGTRVPRLG